MTPKAPLPKAQRITGLVLSSLVALALSASAAGKLAKGPDVVAGFEQLGIPVHLSAPIGIVELVVAVLSVLPWTRFFGVILVTGYMGGAMLTHIRVGEPFIVQFLVGVVAWVGLALRDPRVRELALRPRDV